MRHVHSHLPPTAPPLTCGVSIECSGTRSYENMSRDQRGKIEIFFSSTGACTATKSPIANHRSPIVAQLYFASVTQMFPMPSFVKVESDSSKLCRELWTEIWSEWVQGTFKTAENVNEDKNREFFRTTKSWRLHTPTNNHGKSKNDSNMNCSHNYNENTLKSSDMVIKVSGIVPPGEISECTERKSMTRKAHLSRGHVEQTRPLHYQVDFASEARVLRWSLSTQASISWTDLW